MSWLTNAFLFLFGKFNWEGILEVVLRYGRKKLSDWLGEKDFTLRAKMFVRVMYLLAGELGRQWASDTTFTKIDDTLIDEVEAMCESISEKHGFPLPSFMN